jgi:hypothetical protein
MQVQVYASCEDVDAMLLRLRAAGAKEFPSYSDRETIVCQLPSQQGALQAQVRLTQLAQDKDDPRSATHVLRHEVEIRVDADKVTRLCAVDEIKLTGEAEKVLQTLGFKEEYRLVRSGVVARFKDGWEVDVFQLGEKTRDKRGDVKRLKINPDKPDPLPVIIRSPIFSDEKQANGKIAEAKRLLRRLEPDITAVPVLAVLAAPNAPAGGNAPK